jgi:hypothetical protein
MNPKQLKRVAIVLGVVLLLWLSAELLGGGRDDMETAFVLPALQETNVDSVVFASVSDTIVLARLGGSWLVNGLEASPDEMSAFFAALADASEAELVSTSALLHARMGVDTAGGTSLKLVDGAGVVAALVFGNAGRQYNTRYVRQDSSNFVYLYEGGVSRFIQRSVDDWRNKRMLDIESASLGEVSVRRGRESYTLVQRDSVWRYSTGAAADSAAVRRMLGQYSPLDASGFATEQQVDSADFESPDRSVTMLSQTGDTLAALVFDSTAAAFWARMSPEGTVYRLLQWKVNQMMPADSTLRQRG